MIRHEETENRAAKPVTTSKSGAPEEPTEGRGADRVIPMGEETPQATKSLVEELVSKENMARAYRQVVSNHGSAGVDGMEVEELKAHLKTSWEGIRTSILAGTYRPEAVRKVMIPKASGGKRMLGIPTVTDRLIQQGLSQILGPLWEPTFSDHSYGFRPGRNAHQAVEKARQYQEEGKYVVVDLDLASFFDEVNHSRLMSRIMERTPGDWRLHRLIHQYLKTGILEGGVVSQREKGTPQGSPLSPLLSNIVLDELDKELEKRGHSFVRFADDCNIYVKSDRSADRVLQSVSRYLEGKMRLKVNREKSKVRKASFSKFLGFSFYSNKEGRRVRISEESLARLRKRVKEITRRGRGRNLGRTIEELNPQLRGWVNYYGKADGMNKMEELDQWIRRRLRQILWIHWKRPRTRRLKLMAARLEEAHASQSAYNGRGHWWNAGASHMHLAYPKSYFHCLGLLSLQEMYETYKTKNAIGTAVYGTVRTVV